MSKMIYNFILTIRCQPLKLDYPLLIVSENKGELHISLTTTHLILYLDQTSMILQPQTKRAKQTRYLVGLKAKMHALRILHQEHLVREVTKFLLKEQKVLVSLQGANLELMLNFLHTESQHRHSR